MWMFVVSEEGMGYELGFCDKEGCLTDTCIPSLSGVSRSPSRGVGYGRTSRGGKSTYGCTSCRVGQAGSGRDVIKGITACGTLAESSP